MIKHQQLPRCKFQVSVLFIFLSGLRPAGLIRGDLQVVLDMSEGMISDKKTSEVAEEQPFCATFLLGTRSLEPCKSCPELRRAPTERSRHCRLGFLQEAFVYFDSWSPFFRTKEAPPLFICPNSNLSHVSV